MQRKKFLRLASEITVKDAESESGLSVLFSEFVLGDGHISE